MKNLVKKLIVVAVLSSTSGGLLFAAQAPAAQAVDLSPFISMRAVPASGNLFSHDCDGFLNLVLQLHYHWTIKATCQEQQLVQLFNQATAAGKIALFKFLQANSEPRFREFIKTTEAGAFLMHYLPRYGWSMNDLAGKFGVIRLQGQVKAVEIIALTEWSDEVNLAINTQKMELYNPEIKKAAMARQPVPVPQPARVANPARVAALAASGVLSDQRCGVMACRSGNGLVGELYISADDDVDETARIVEDDFVTEILQPYCGGIVEPASKRYRLGGDEDEKKAN